jgi:hypothetical protein
MSLWLQRYVYDHVEVRGSPRSVLAFLAFRADDDTQECWPSIKNIAHCTKLDRRTVQRDLRTLETRELLATRPGVGRTQVSRYVVCPAARRPKKAAPTPPFPREKAASDPIKGGTGAALNLQGTVSKDPADAPAAHRRVAASHKTRKGPRTAPPDGRIKTLLDEFCEQHRQALHQPYRVVGGRDGKQLQEALRLYQDADQIRTAMHTYFCDEKELHAFPPSVPHFVGRIAFLLSRSGPISPAPTFVFADREKAAVERAAADAAAADYRAKKGRTRA